MKTAVGRYATLLMLVLGAALLEVQQSDAASQTRAKMAYKEGVEPP